MKDGMYILDALQIREYEPQMNASPGEDWFDRCCGDATVRIVLTRDGAAVHMFGPHMVSEWSVQFSHNTPSEVILAALYAAEETTLADE